nr:MAG TPA: hypothetical protein [Caudoviricetes sp.]
MRKYDFDRFQSKYSKSRKKGTDINKSGNC